jgi:ubiquitin C-terminal hydrolase
LINALSTIFNGKSTLAVDNFFHSVKDFNGLNNRFGQLAVSDFLEYLVSQAPNVLSTVRCSINKRLQCLKCQWISSTSSEDIFYRLYIPPGFRNSISLTDLVNYNSRSRLYGANSLWCGNCGIKTEQSDVRDSNSDIIMFEIIRVTRNSQSVWTKNCLPINFTDRNISFGSRKYHLAGTCHHKGTLKFGHWITKLCLSDGNWYELNDLKITHQKTMAPGSNDSTAVILVFLAADKFL